jgi:hypothetical protein
MKNRRMAKYLRGGSKGPVARRPSAPAPIPDRGRKHLGHIPDAHREWLALGHKLPPKDSPSWCRSRQTQREAANGQKPRGSTEGAASANGTCGSLRPPRGSCQPLVLSPSQLDDGIDQSTTRAPTAIIESTAFAISSAGQGMILTEGEGGGGPG